MAELDPAQHLLQFFPREMLNLDQNPPGMTIGPLHAILTWSGQALANFQSDALLAQAQLTVQQASGLYLDRHGIFYSTPRIPGEGDESYRARILLAIRFGKLTIAAITAAVQAYYASGFVAPRSVVVFDMQSDPLASAPIPLYPEDFVISLTIWYPATLAFWAGRSYATNTPPGAIRIWNTYVISTNPYIFPGCPEPNLCAVVNRTKAAGTHPVYTSERRPSLLVSVSVYHPGLTPGSWILD